MRRTKQNDTERCEDEEKKKEELFAVCAVCAWETSGQGERKKKIIYLFLMLDVYNEHIFRLNTCINL